MGTVQLREAKATLPALAEEAARGDTAVITRRGQSPETVSRFAQAVYIPVGDD